jgi:hypothetical protein
MSLSDNCNPIFLYVNKNQIWAFPFGSGLLRALLVTERSRSAGLFSPAVEEPPGSEKTAVLHYHYGQHPPSSLTQRQSRPLQSMG